MFKFNGIMNSSRLTVLRKWKKANEQIRYLSNSLATRYCLLWQNGATYQTMNKVC